jgi:hypothetical protein
MGWPPVAKGGTKSRSSGKKKGNSGYRQSATDLSEGTSRWNRAPSLLPRKLFVNRTGGLFAGAHGEDDRGGARDDVAAGIDALFD